MKPDVLVRHSCTIVYHIWSVRRLWPREPIFVLHLALGPYFQYQSQSRSQGLGMRLAVSQRKLTPTARSAPSTGPTFSILPTSCRESAGGGNCQDRNGEMDGHRLTGYTRLCAWVRRSVLSFAGSLARCVGEVAAVQ